MMISGLLHCRIAAGAFFLIGLLISEVWFGWATEEQLQPNIDGLSFDEVLLGLIPAVAAVLVIRHRSRRKRAETKGVVPAGSQR